MKKLALLAIISATISLGFIGENKQDKVEEDISSKERLALEENAYAVPQADDTITIREIADFLSQKKEHYPLSDEFIEKYQQTGGGYIDYAKEKGLVVNKQLHEPNQKWHFMTSWLELSIEQGTLTWDADAKRRVYTGLLCPELLLWIYEACEVSPSKVRQAKEVAEQGKAAKTGVSTIAKNMRAIVSWEDVSKAIFESRG